MSLDPCLNRVSNKVMNKALVTLVALLSLIFLVPGSSSAQLDSTFGAGGVAAPDIIGTPIDTVLLPDGKILVVSEDDNSNTTDPAFTRFNSDGTVDTTYGTNGTVRLTIPYINPASGTILRATRQADGKILLTGVENDHGVITRFYENGTLDTSFANNGIHDTTIGGNYDVLQSVIQLPDGKILVVGSAHSDSGSPMADILILRFNADGGLDPTFGNGSGFVRHFDGQFSGFGHIEAFRQSDGRLIVFRTLGSDYSQATRIRRFNADGTLDNSYANIYLNGAYSKATLQADDKLVLAGDIDKNDTLARTHTDISVLRYTAAGTPDTSFGTNGAVTFDVAARFDDTPKAVRVMADGQILVSSLTRVPLNRTAAKGYYVSLARVSADGSTVTGKFLQNYVIYNAWRTDKDTILMLQPDGKILTVYLREGGSRPYLVLARSVGVPVETYRFRGAAFDFNYDPYPFMFPGTPVAGTSEPTIYRPGTQRWYTTNLGNQYPTFGIAGDIPVPSDYVGNFGTDLAVFRPSTGTWYIATSMTAPPTNIYVVQWGTDGDTPTPADYDGDGKSDVAIFRPSTGAWWIRNSSDGGSLTVLWGMNGDKPVAGDYDGDGLADIAVWRPSDGVWYVLRSSDGQVTYFTFGMNGDVPVQEDFDGDGKTDIAVWRPSNGVWYVARSSDGGFTYLTWGLSGDIAVPADYDGDGKADIAVWRPSTAQWYMHRSSDNGYTQVWWGVATDLPAQRRN